MKKNHPILFVGLLLTLALLSAALRSVASAAQDDTPVTDRAVVERAWALTHQSNSFAYTSRITQTVHPAATLGNIGRTPQTDQIGLQGRLDRAAESVDLTLWPDAAFDPDSGIALQLRGNRVYQRAADGAWREVENMTGLAAPGGDPLAFLSGVTNVAVAGAENRVLPGTDTTVHYTRYTFDFNGAAFAEHVRVATQRQMQTTGDLLPQMELERSAVLTQTTGSGEMWIDDYGLPVRLSLSLDLGEQANGERASAEITTDLSDFDLTGISAAATPFHRDPALWLRTRLLTPAVADTAASTALVLVVLAAVVLSIPYWQHRRFYNGVAIALVFSMVVPPLLDTYQVHAFSTNQAARQAQFEADRTEADSFRAAQEQLTATTWQPLQNPLPAGRDQMLFDNLPTSFPLQYTSVITATDTDGDGLSDADEDIYESCADPLLCPDLDATDSDGDGLGDGLEVHALGTLPNSWDTDDDLITDTLEISGFSYNGLTWYLDPTEADSNRDGLSDTIECEVWTDISPLFDPLAACPDTDGDGTPDVFDSDNDNDGVHDSVDLSPFDASTVSFSGAAPFELTVSNAAVGQPLLVDLQIRPNNPDHLTYYNSVLDWPSGDTLGQVVRTASTTWADTLNTDLQSTDANAANGDIRLVPLLEVTIPYTTGHYANLPVLESAPITRTQTMTVGQWLDTTELTAHGLSVVDAPDGSGDLVLYAPLVLQKNETEGGPAAFYARLFYWPEQGSGGFVNWGSRQQARLAWSVQMLVNDCTTPGDPTTCSATDKLAVVHRYVDDWTLTGMTIAEQHGYDVALLYEDPDSDPDLTADDQLWALSWQLGNTFLRGRDCEPFVAEVCQPDGQRDVQIDNVVLRMNDWFTDTIYTVVGANSYPHIGYQGYVATVDVPNVLNNDFATHTDIQPTILFMQETTQRSTALGDGIVLNGVLATADLDPTVHSLDVVTGLNWAPYHYLDGSWQSMPLSTYLSGLVATYQTVPFFQPLDASVPLSVDEADGKLIWLQLYYATLVEGVTQLVQTDSTLLWAPFPTPELPEFSVTSSSLPSRSRTGVSWVAYEWKGNLDVIANVPKGQGSGWGWFVYRLRLNAEANRLTVGLKKNFFNSTRIGTYNLALQGAMLATATAVAALAAGGLLSGNSVVQDVGKYVGLVLSIVVLTIAFGNWVQAARLALNGGRWFSSLRKLKTASKNFRSGPAGIALGIVISFAMLTLLVITGKLTPGTIEFNFALAATLADVIVALAIVLIELVLYTLGLAPLLLLFYLIDALVELFGVKGLTARLTEWLAQWLFVVETSVTNLSDQARLDFALAGMALTDAGAGFRVGNSFALSMTVTNTLRYNDRMTEELARRNTFRYFIDTGPIEREDQLALSQMENEWQVPGDKQLRVRETVRSTTPITFTASGVNAVPNAYLTESFVSFYEQCWLGFGTFFEELRCDLTEFRDSMPLPVGDSLIFDVFPPTLAAFHDMAWSFPDRITQTLTLPLQTDHDSDGLLSKTQGGTDPDDTQYDVDGDTLSDYFEQSIGTNPLLADTDGDGLSDAEEQWLRTNALLADTDGDGLNDYTEVHGWLYAYQTTPTVRTMRVWSDPFSADFDADNLSDLDEFIFAQHPRVPTDASILRTQVTFDNLYVSETDAPRLLLPFDESVGATAFANVSGAVRYATCSAACPQAGGAGVFGAALTLNGVDEAVQISDADAYNFDTDDDFTVAVWVRPDSLQSDLLGPNNVIVEKWPVQGGESAWPFTIRYYNQNVGNHGRLYVSRSDGLGIPAAIVSTQTINDGAFHHIAFVKQGETLSLYLDGALEGTAIDTTNGPTTNSSALFIGRTGVPPIEGANFFGGDIDDLLIFDRALSAESITTLVSGRYDLDDHIVAPGAPLTYGATVTNTNALLAANGNLVATSRYLDPLIDEPEMVLNFAAEDFVTFIPNDKGESSQVSCINTACPTADALALAFDGAEDVLTIPPFIYEDTSLTLAFRIKVDTLPAAGTVRHIVDTARSADGTPVTGDLDIWLDSAGYLWFDVAGDTPTTLLTGCSSTSGDSCTTSNPWTQPQRSDTVLSPGVWRHVLWAATPLQTRLYVDGDLDSWYLVSATPPVVVGPGTLGGARNSANLFDGSLDELVVYDKEHWRIGGIVPDPVLEIVAGRYTFKDGGSNNRVYVPTALYTFNGYVAPGDSPASVFANLVGAPVVCASAATCPATVANGYVGPAVDFDGIDDYLPLAQRATGQEVSVSFKLKVEALPAAGQTVYILDSLSTDPTAYTIVPAVIALGADGLLTYPVSGVFGYLSLFNFGTALGQWVDVTFNTTADSCDGNPCVRITTTVNGTPKDHEVPTVNYMTPTEVGDGRLGSRRNGTGFFNGQIDEFKASATTFPDTTDLYDVPFTPAPAPQVGWRDGVSDGRTAFCDTLDSCPLPAPGGLFGDLLALDGSDDFLRATPIDLAGRSFTVAF